MANDALDKLTKHDPYGLDAKTVLHLGQFMGIKGLRKDTETLDGKIVHLPKGGRRTDRRRTNQRKTKQRRIKRRKSTKRKNMKSY